MEARRSASKLRQAKFKAKKREEKKQQEEKVLESLCFPPHYCHLYEGPESDKNEDERKQRHKRVKRNIKKEEKILKEERDLENECRSKFPHLRLYGARLPGENNDEKRARRRKIHRQMAAMEKHQSNAMVLDQVVEEGLNKTGGVESNAVVVDQVMEEAMGQPGQFAREDGRLRGVDGVQLNDTQQEVWAREDSDQFVLAATPTCHAADPVTTSQMNPRVSTDEVAPLNNQLGLTTLAGSQNDTGGVDAKVVRFRFRAEDGDLNETDGLDASVRCMSQQISTASVAAFNNQLRVEDRHTHNVVAVVPPLMDPYARQKWKCPDCGEHGWFLHPLVASQLSTCSEIASVRICPWCGAVFLGHYVEEKFEKWTGQYFNIYPDGAVYWGHFVEGKFDGEGIFMFPANNCDDLVMYHGSWKAGQKEGHGKLVWDDGAEYVGDFKDDECHGQGKITMPSDDQLEYEYVLWNNLQGMKQLRTIDFNTDELKTDLTKWLRNQIPPNGDTYKGQWKYGKREGVHVKTSSEGQLLAIEKYVDDEIVCSEVRPTGYCEEEQWTVKNGH